MIPSGLHAIDGGAAILTVENQKIHTFGDASGQRIPLMSISKPCRWRYLLQCLNIYLGIQVLSVLYLVKY